MISCSLFLSLRLGFIVLNHEGGACAYILGMGELFDINKSFYGYKWKTACHNVMRVRIDLYLDLYVYVCSTSRDSYY